MVVPFATLLLREQPRIARAVESLTAALPSYVRPAAEYALNGGGKRLRPLLTVLVSHALGGKDKDQDDGVYKIGAAIEMFHVASLLHDDILDNAPLRRGREGTHIRYGVPRTLLTADAMVSRAFQTLAETGDPRYMVCATRAVIGTADGEIMEIAHQGSTEGGLDGYFTIIAGKTACLLRASCELGALWARADEATLGLVAEYGHNLGMAFQMADDALDFAPSSETGKPEGGDIREGKLTPPINYHMESLDAPARAEFARRFAARDFSDAEIAELVRAVRAGGFQERTLKLADSFLDKAAAALEGFPAGNDAQAKAALAKAIEFVRNRTA